MLRISGMTSSQSPFASPRRYSASDLSLLHLVMASTLASAWIPPRSVGSCCCPFSESRPTGVPRQLFLPESRRLVLPVHLLRNVTECWASTWRAGAANQKLDSRGTWPIAGEVLRHGTFTGSGVVLIRNFARAIEIAADCCGSGVAA